MTIIEAMTRLPLKRRRLAPAPVAGRQGAGRGGAPDEIDPRRATLRQINELSLELYLAGELGFPESAYFGRQPEHHPAYGRSVGRLTGIDSRRDLPANQLRVWEDRLAFAERYLADDRQAVQRLRRIVGALRRLTARLDAAGHARGRLAG